MTSERVIGINGLGRVAKSLLKRIKERDGLEGWRIVANEIDPDLDGIAYFLKHESLDGGFTNLGRDIRAVDGGISYEGRFIPVYHESDITQVPWKDHGVTHVVDSSGAYADLDRSRMLADQGVKRVIVTQGPDEGIDKYVVVGVNHKDIRPEHFILSSSICDTTALAPTVQLLDREYGIKSGSVLTLHPWLGDQNLLDGRSTSISTASGSLRQMGRKCTEQMIPKNTTTVKCTEQVLPDVAGKLMVMSYRIPTAEVSSFNLHVQLESPEVAREDVIGLFEGVAEKQRHAVFFNSYGDLVSGDFAKSPFSANVDHRWTEVNQDGLLRVVAWYDNEYGYASRVLDLMDILAKEDQ